MRHYPASEGRSRTYVRTVGAPWDSNASFLLIGGKSRFQTPVPLSGVVVRSPPRAALPGLDEGYGARIVDGNGKPGSVENPLWGRW